MSPVRHTVPILTCAAFVYKVPTCQSVPRLKEYEKQVFDACLNSANDNFNDIILIESFPVAKHVFSLQINKCPRSDTQSPFRRFVLLLCIRYSPHFDVLFYFCV